MGTMSKLEAVFPYEVQIAAKWGGGNIYIYIFVFHFSSLSFFDTFMACCSSSLSNHGFECGNSGE